MMEGVFLLLGSNLGDCRASLDKARNAIEKNLGLISLASSIRSSSPWGVTNQPDFLNQVIKIDTELDPFELITRIQEIEINLGRIRFEKWGPRVIDIDILYYGHRIIESENLLIPHPGIADRRFTLEPLNEIAPDFMHPVLLKTNRDLLMQCKDPSGVQSLLEA